MTERAPIETEEESIVDSKELKDPDWNNSTVIDGDAVEEVHKLKQQPGKNIAVLGGGELVQTLIENISHTSTSLPCIPSSWKAARGCFATTGS
jgi:dihydrofolate reductase